MMQFKRVLMFLALGCLFIIFTSCEGTKTPESGVRPLDLSQESGQTRYALALGINEALYQKCKSESASCSAGPITMQSKAESVFQEILKGFSERLRDDLTNPANASDLRAHPAIRIPVQNTPAIVCPAGKFRTCAYTCDEVPSQFEPGEDPDDPVPGANITICECKCFCTYISLRTAAACNAN